MSKKLFFAMPPSAASLFESVMNMHFVASIDGQSCNSLSIVILTIFSADPAFTSAPFPQAKTVTKPNTNKIVFIAPTLLNCSHPLVMHELQGSEILLMSGIFGELKRQLLEFSPSPGNVP